MSRTLSQRRRGHRLLAALACALLAPATAAAADERRFELVTPAGSEAAEPTAVHSFLDGDAFGYQGYDGILGAPQNVWTAYTARRTPTGWSNQRWFGEVPLRGVYGGSNARSPVATQPIGYSADGRTMWIATLLPLVPEDQNTDAADAADYYAVTDGKPVLITRRPDGTAAGITDLAGDHGAGDAYVAPGGNRLIFSLPATKPIAESGLGTSLFAADADGTVTRLDESAGPMATLLTGRPIADDGTRVLYPKGGRLLLWDDGTINDLGTLTVRSHLSRDGKLVAFASRIGGDTVDRIYRYDVETGTTTLLSAAHDAAAPTAAAVLVDTSDDGGAVVLRSRDPLTPDAAGIATGTNWHHYVHAGGTLRLIGTFPIAGALGGIGMRTLPDGTFIFSSNAALLPADGDATTDVYRWTPAAGLALLSTGPAGGNAATPVRFNGPAVLPMGLTQDPQIVENERLRPAALTSEDGRWVFFSSTEALTADAGDNGREKVYGSHDGVLTLISPAGADARPARYLGNNSTGRDVFIATDQALDPRDTDGAYGDIYSARIGGGFPPPPPPPLDPCPANACPLPPAPPAPPLPGTIAFNGPGDATPAGDPSNRFTLKGKPAPTLRIAVPGEGRLSLTATRRIGKRTRTVLSRVVHVRRAGTQRVALKLNRTGRSALRRTKAARLKLRVAIRFEPTGGLSRTRTVAVTFKTKSSTRTR